MANPTDKEIDSYASSYVLNGCQSDALRAAFPDSKAKGETIHVKASVFHALDKVKVRIEILKEQVRAIAEKEFNVDATWVLKQAVEVHNRCMVSAKVFTAGGKPVTDDDGNPVYSFQHVGANKSLEIIGKHIDVQAFNENLSIKSGSEVTPWGEIKASVDNLEEDE